MLCYVSLSLSPSKEKEDAGKDAPEAVFSSPRLTRKFPSKSNQQKKMLQEGRKHRATAQLPKYQSHFPARRSKSGEREAAVGCNELSQLCGGKKKKSALWAKLCGAKEKLINKFSASRSACQYGFVNEYLWVVVCIRAKISGVCRLVVLYEDFVVFFFCALVEDCKICIL